MLTGFGNGWDKRGDGERGILNTCWRCLGRSVEEGLWGSVGGEHEFGPWCVGHEASLSQRSGGAEDSEAAG